MPRRGNNIRKRKDGRWEGRYKSGFKSDGSVKYRSVYAPTYADCKRKLIQAQSCKDDKTSTRCPDQRFSDVLLSWLSTNRVRIKGATEVKYTRLIETHIIPALGGFRIDAVDSKMINSFLDCKLQSGGLKSHAALSPSYVRTMAIIIESTINYAVMEGLRSPLRTPINKPSISKKEVSVLDNQAEVTLTKAMLCDSSPVAIGVLLALQGGLRIGEVCALKWQDVDFETGLIHVRHTVSRVPCQHEEQRTTLVIDTPKTMASARDVPMPSSLKSILQKAHDSRCSEYVVSNTHTFVGTRTFDYQYRRLLCRHGIRIVNFHTLRHTYATRCAEAGMDAKTLSRLLGHSSANISLNIYVHPSLEGAANQLEQIFCAR